MILVIKTFRIGRSLCNQFDITMYGYTRTLLSTFIIAVVICSCVPQYLDISSNSLAVLGPLSRVAVVAGDDADLPCDVRPTVRNDTMLLVVWYRVEDPIYSYDRRIQGPKAHWLDDDLAGRVQWMSSPNSVLHMQGVQPKDRAIYRCRVDFLLSPTKNFQVALDVIELPGKPVIFDEFGREISGAAGSYKEGSGFKLICTVNGGVPVPRIQWLQGDKVLATLTGGNIEEVASSRSLELYIRNATRSHHSLVYTCTADNTKLTQPQRTTVRVDLYLKPRTVEILSRELPLTVGRIAELWCKSTGARPPANITWWLDGKKMHSTTKHQELQERNETESMLQWMPLKEHNGKTLVCKAEHIQFDKSTIEAKQLLNVYYMPEATMHLGSKMNPNDIEEGDDVYFECEVDANPPAYKVLWEHNGVLLQHNPSQGVILTANTNLALRNITRHQAGNYSCIASNVEGDGRSQPLRMQVIYKPLCRRKDMRVIGAALQEPARIECQVDAFPAPHAFEWTLNNSVGSIKVDPDRFTIEAEEGRSVLSYTPVAEVDYGTLSCRASNLAGRQAAACLYTLLPATHPDPPTNCTVYNLTDDALDLICLPGYEGGLQNVYIAEVWANEGLVVNASNGVAVWNLRRLGAKRRLQLVVYAANARGRSEHVTFTVRTAAKLLPRTEAQESWEINWAMGGVAGAAVTVALILFLAFLAMRLRHRYCARDYEVTTQPTKNQKASLQKGNSPDDCNPDLIPLSKEMAEGPPEPPQYSAVVSKPECKNSSSSHSLARTHSPNSPQPSYPPHFDSQNNRNCANGSRRVPREIVTTRTPLLAAHQESCV